MNSVSLSSVPEMMEWGLRGASLPPRRALRWRLASLVIFLALWSVAGGFVEARRPFNPLFLPAPWVVIGALLDLARKGQLWVHVAATLERIRRRDRLAFLAEGAKQPPDDLGLPVEGDQAFFQRPRESQVVIDLEELIGRQDHLGGGGCRRPRRRKSHGPTL